MAYDRGYRAAKVWDRFSEGSNKKSDKITVRDWNRRNAAKLAGNNRRISQVDGRDVKPRVLEKFNKKYKEALKRGDLAAAADIRSDCEEFENRIPIIGPGLLIYDNITEGDYIEGSLNIITFARQAGLAIKTRGASLIGEIVKEAAFVGIEKAEEKLFIKPTIKEQAIDIKKKLNNGKNSLTIQTPNKQIGYDLDGKPHANVDTPHKQVYKKNKLNEEVKSISRENKGAKPLVQKDIRIIRKFFKRFKKIK